MAVIVALMLGYYWARWRRAEGSRQVGPGAGRRGRESGVEGTRGDRCWFGVAVYVVLHVWLDGRAVT